MNIPSYTVCLKTSYDKLVKKYLKDKGNTKFQHNEIYYIKFPNVENQYNQEEIKFLSQFYHIIGEITVQEKGYILSAVQMQLNEVIGEEGNQ